jgi:hypothetical protein
MEDLYYNTGASTADLAFVVSKLEILPEYERTVKKLKRDIEKRFSKIKPNDQGVKCMDSDKNIFYHHHGVLNCGYLYKGEEVKIILSPFKFELPKETQPVHPDKPSVDEKILKRQRDEGKVTITSVKNTIPWISDTTQFYKWLYCKKQGVKLRKGGPFKEKTLLDVLNLVKEISKEELNEREKNQLLRQVIKSKFENLNVYDEDERTYTSFIYLICEKIGLEWVTQDKKSHYGGYDVLEEIEFGRPKKYSMLFLKPTLIQINDMRSCLYDRRRWVEEERKWVDRPRSTFQIDFDTIEELLTKFKEEFKEYENKDDIYFTLDKMGFDVSEYLPKKEVKKNVRSRIKPKKKVLQLPKKD